jgi:two-component system sensor histidine kinase/response regulator
MDGLELARAIKADPANGGLKLVLMTSMAQRGHAAQSEQVGLAGYLQKPVRQSQLYDCLRTVMGPSTQHPPPAARHTPRIVTAHTMREAKDLRRPRVLLAEDNQTNQMAAVRMLEMLGYQVDVAVNGIEAVAACREVEYGIVFMDNQMPEMDGLTAAREIRKLEAGRGTPAVPIVALTADAMQGDREKCMTAGMNDYLSKPFKVAQLSEVLDRWAQLPRSDATPADSGTPAPHESAIDSSVFDDFRGPVVSRSANDFVIKLIGDYLAESATCMTALRDAVVRSDAPAMKIAAHSLKGSSSTMGARRMAALCDELETLARNTTLGGAPALIVALDGEFVRVEAALHNEQRISA